MSAQEMDLVLWRHAEAEDGLNDSARALTKRGRKQAAQMAKWLKARLPEGTSVVISPAKRTEQTAEPLGMPCRSSAKVGTSASPADVLDEVGWQHRSGTVVVVGHQPTLGRVAALLLSGTAADWTIKKGAVWWISCRRREGREEISLKAAIAPDLV